MSVPHIGILAPYFQTGKTKRSGKAHDIRELWHLYPPIPRYVQSIRFSKPFKADGDPQEHLNTKRTPHDVPNYKECHSECKYRGYKVGADILTAIGICQGNCLSALLFIISK